MGEPILEAAKIPVALANFGNTDRVVNAPLIDFEVPLVDAAMENELRPGHENDLCLDGQSARDDLLPRCFGRSRSRRSAQCSKTHRVFPQRINVHFVQVHSPQEVTMRTWERGSGITLACGTGASAVCVAGVLTGRTGRKILAHLPGGDLELEWNETDNHVYMTGPATEVFTGEWPD